MGSESNYLNVEETAAFLGVKPSEVHHLQGKGYIEAHYINGSRGGKHFLREDVYALMEVRANERKGLTSKLPLLITRATLVSKRAEKKIDELYLYLGMGEERLKLEPTEVRDFYESVQVQLKARKVIEDNDILRWARKILFIDEDYLELTASLTGDVEPWRLFNTLCENLLIHAGDGRIRAYVEHAKRNLRNASYFFERSINGMYAAKRKFPGQTYAGKLLRSILPG